MTSLATQPAVLVEIAQAALHERVAGIVAGAQFLTTDSVERLPQQARLDLVVSSQAGALARHGLATAAPADVGLIVIGSDDPTADAQLPADFSDRELELACRLVGRLVQWRRKALLTAETGRELERLAHTDALTQVANRRAWDVELPRRLHAAAAAGQAMALAIFDVDHFKLVNDGRGHAAGDAVLAAIGRGLAEALRATDFVARLGGDEFGLLLVGSIAPQSVHPIVERVRAHAMHHLTRGAGSAVTLSAGCVAVPPGTSIDAAHLFAAADEALRQAKQAGRNRTVMHPR